MSVIDNPTQRLSRPSSRSPVQTVLTHTLYHLPEPPRPLQCIPAISNISCISGGRPTHPGPASQPIPGFSCPSRSPTRNFHCIIRQNRLDLYSVSQLFPTFPVFPVADLHTRALHPSRFLDSHVRVGHPHETFTVSFARTAYTFTVYPSYFRHFLNFRWPTHTTDPQTRPTHSGPASQPIPGFSCPSRLPARTV